MANTLYIRADGNSQMGLGHLVRGMALAQMLQHAFDIHFFCLSAPTAIVSQIQSLGFGYHELAHEGDFLRQLTPQTVVVLDGYHFDSAYQQTIREKAKALVYIDDLHDRTFWADLILNTAPGSLPANYQAQSYTRFALGPAYALLRPAFLAQARKLREIQQIETLFICFGGADPTNLTEKVLRAAGSFAAFKTIHVVTGSAYAFLSTLQNSVAGDKRIRHQHAIPETEMLKVMVESELAIVPASGILSEVLAAKAIPISGNYVSNQSELYARYKQLGVLIDAGQFSDEEVHAAIDKALQHTGKLPNPIDGFSGVRVLLKFSPWMDAYPMQLRAATQNDLQKTFDWAGNPAVRAFSPNKTIVFGEHSTWFEAKITSLNCVYLMAEIGYVPAGSIRFDINNGIATISYLVEPALQGLGLGNQLLKMGVETLYKHTAIQQIHTIQGYVMPENLASVKSFEKEGYTKNREGEMYKFEKNVD